MEHVRDDDPATGRRFLTRSAYADDRHLRSRQAIFAYADAPADPRWRTSFVGWDGTQIVADVGCGNGFDLRQIVPDGRCRHAIGVDLSAGMLRSLGSLVDSGRLSLVQADAQQLPLADASVDVAMAMHMLYHVSDIPAVVQELRRIVKPGGTLLASTNRSGTLAEINELFNVAVSAQFGRTLDLLPALSFTIETGAGVLGREFPAIAVHRHDLPLSFPDAEPVIGYLASLREPIIANIKEPLDFDAALADVAARVDQVIRTEGRFRTTFRTGVFVCR
ncbi:MAG TPA: class I SAM-dependent methyltransferase [Streptosporangiaceae bacterium]|nr:class I SAM-dependent methyltransferase [Streptosporangiaceae bacterium]